MNAPKDKRKKRILYVEDNKFDQKAFLRFVDKNKLPYEVEITSSISECKKILESESFDVILHDFELQDGNALDTLRLNTIEPIIIITGAGNEETAVQCMKENAYDYIIKDTEGNYLKVLTPTIENVIKRKETEEQLKLIRYSIDNATEPTFLISPSGEILFANQAVFESLKYSQEEFASLTWDVIAPEMSKEKIKKLVKKLKEKGTTRFETSYQRKDGDIYPVDILANYEVFGKKEYIFVFAHDITEQKKIEEEKQKIKKLESLGILAGGIAHDFNKFLKSITGNISLAILKVKDNDEVVNILNEAREATVNAKNLTKQLLTFSGGGIPDKKKISLSNIIKEITELKLKGSDVKCFYDFPANIWEIQADRDQIIQVIGNIVANAEQAMPLGGTIKTSLKNEVIKEDTTLPLKAGRYVKMTIEDKGVGIAKKHLPLIFDPYFTTKQRGSGMGLTTTYSLIEKHDGHITVDSKLGEGSTFCVYLPATTPEKSTKKSESQ